MADNEHQAVDHIQLDKPNQHDVTPHWRTLPDGREIWIDGDTNVDRSHEQGGGWTQSNPHYHSNR
ncbi:hypothetical protein [Peribacillus deserti]|uniref:Uncharacterized protein n=1 Tax=Peribacillus deserti TaxID=673318 RepID=A0A2N5M623_9BACI|nr:hypothetical protein [Peribacillus deserti]PLT29811.1 hypothetical protein CUU66_10935 [Peribacillus deserti]